MESRSEGLTRQLYPRVPPAPSQPSSSPRITESSASLRCLFLSSILPSMRSIHPPIPDTLLLHLLIQSRIFQLLLNLGARKTFAERVLAIGHAPRRHRRNHRVDLQFANIHFVER